MLYPDSGFRQYPLLAPRRASQPAGPGVPHLRLSLAGTGTNDPGRADQGPWAAGRPGCLRRGHAPDGVMGRALPPIAWPATQ